MLTLSAADLATQELANRRLAAKRLAPPETRISKGSERDLANEIRDRHVSGTRTIVVLNSVDRAVKVFEALRATKGAPATVLIHSRFRPADRAASLENALAPDFTGIVVSTQVIEAGVDISSRTLVTELAPWPSIVQRCGRCNQAGELAEADVWWVDHEDLAKTSPPYEEAEMASARRLQRREEPAPGRAARIPARARERACVAPAGSRGRSRSGRLPLGRAPRQGTAFHPLDALRD